MATIQQTEQPTTPGIPPTAQEIQRKLSVAQRKGKSRAPAAQNSGTDTEDEALIVGPSNDAGLPASQPLSAIAERTVSGGEESEEEEEDVAGGWRHAKSVEGHIAGASAGNVVMHTGYLWKKGSGRRKTWKKRWFVLRPTHLACYKTSAEYKLLRLLEISDIHAATTVQLKRHPNTIGIVTQARTFYFQAETPTEIDQWIVKINEAKDALQSASIPGTPVVIPPSAKVSGEGPPRPANVPPVSPKQLAPISIKVPTGSTVVFSEPTSPISATASTSRNHPAALSNTSSDSEEGAISSGHSPRLPPAQRLPPAIKDKDIREKEKDMKLSGKPILSGYLMKCRTHRKIWRKRWFILTPTKLVYMGSHMDAKPHREFALTQILDAMEYRPISRHISPNRPITEQNASLVETPSNQRAPNHGQQSSNVSSQPDEGLGSNVNYTFKIITPKKTLLLCAPSEEEEVKWISAIRALIARRNKEKERDMEHSTGHSRERDADGANVNTGSAGTHVPGGEHLATEDREKRRPVSKGAPTGATTTVTA